MKYVIHIFLAWTVEKPEIKVIVSNTVTTCSCLNKENKKQFFSGVVIKFSHLLENFHYVL